MIAKSAGTSRSRLARPTRRSRRAGGRHALEQRELQTSEHRRAGREGEAVGRPPPRLMVTSRRSRGTGRGPRGRSSAGEAAVEEREGRAVFMKRRAPRTSSSRRCGRGRRCFMTFGVPFVRYASRSATRVARSGGVCSGAGARALRGEEAHSITDHAASAPTPTRLIRKASVSLLRKKKPTERSFLDCCLEHEVFASSRHSITAAANAHENRPENKTCRRMQAMAHRLARRGIVVPLVPPHRSEPGDRGRAALSLRRQASGAAAAAAGHSADSSADPSARRDAGVARARSRRRRPRPRFPDKNGTTP